MPYVIPREEFALTIEKLVFCRRLCAIFCDLFLSWFFE